MARQDALSIYINDTEKDKLAETYGDVIEAIQKGAVSEQIKNKNYTNIVMWSESKERYDKYLQDGCIKDIIPDFVASKDIILTNSYEEAVKDAEVLIVATESYL